MQGILIARKRSINLLLIASMVASLLVLPTQIAKAGMLSSLLCKLRPLLGMAGKVGGAVIGASMCSAFCPPLGMIAGGIAGWIAGGIITGTATTSLGNLAAVGGGVIGAMALGPGAVGMIGGFLLGAFLGKTAVNLLKKADQATTGGILLAPAGVSASSSGAALAPMSPSSSASVASSQSTPRVNSSQEITGSARLQAAQEKYQKAYVEYTTAVRCGDSQNATSMHKTYLQAYQEYQDVLRSK